MPSQNPNNNGYGSMNDYKRNNGMGANNIGKNNKDGGVSGSLKEAKHKQKKETIRKAIIGMAPTFLTKGAVRVASKTDKGEQLLDKAAEAKTPAEGVARVAKEVKKDLVKMKMIFTFAPIILVLLILMIIIPVIFSNADSQIFGNENGGDVISEENNDDKEITDIFTEYPLLYERINNATYEYSNDYGVDIDRLLVIATLVAPLENGFFTPFPCDEKDSISSSDKALNNQSFERNNEADSQENDEQPNDENLCVMYKGELLKWNDFLSSWGYNAYLLSAMQMMTYVDFDYTNGKNKNNTEFCKPGPSTMQEIAKNDPKINEKCFGKSLFNKKKTDISFLECLFNGKSYENEAKVGALAEQNIYCTKATRIDIKDSDEKYPMVRVLSIDEGEYEVIQKESNVGNSQFSSESVDRSSDSSNNTLIVKENPNTGGVYFWNLVNEDGFIYNYLTKYQDTDTDDDNVNEDIAYQDEKKYEDSKYEIYELARYIYDYYYSIRKDCRSIEIVPKPTETTSSNVEYDKNVENQVFNSLLKYYDSEYITNEETKTYAIEYYKALSIIIRSNILNGEIVPDADKIGKIDENTGLAKSNIDESIDKSDMEFKDIINLIQSSYGTKGIIITEKDADKEERIIKKVEIDEFCPQTYAPVNSKISKSSQKIEEHIEIETGSFYLDSSQRKLPIRTKDIKFYIGNYSEEEGYGKDGIDCPCFMEPKTRPIPNALVNPNDPRVNLSCGELDRALETNNLFEINGYLGIPEQKVRGKCLIIKSKRPDTHGCIAGLKYKPGRTDYDENSPKLRGISTVALRYFANQGYNWRGLLRLFLDRTSQYDEMDEYHITFKRIDESLQEGECQNHGYTKESIIKESKKCNKNDECKRKIKEKISKKW